MENGILFLKKKIKSPLMEKKFVRKIQTSGPSLKNLFLFTTLIFFSFFGIDHVYGHGFGSEIFPPVELDGRLVTLEVSSSQNNPETNDDQQIFISLIDFNSKSTLRDVTFLITSERGETFLFEQEFKADHGFIVFNFTSEDTDPIATFFFIRIPVVKSLCLIRKFTFYLDENNYRINQKINDG